MDIETALQRADEWTQGATFHENSEGWKPAIAALAEEVRRLQSRDQWLPIETAPKKTGQLIVVVALDVKLPWREHGPLYNSDPYCVFWLDGEWARWPHDFKPTHWLPLPTNR